jgi:hypothetical protein
MKSRSKNLERDLFSMKTISTSTGTLKNLFSEMKTPKLNFFHLFIFVRSFKFSDLKCKKNLLFLGKRNKHIQIKNFTEIIWSNNENKLNRFRFKLNSVQIYDFMFEIENSFM